MGTFVSYTLSDFPVCVCVCVCARALEIESRPYDIIMAGKKVIYFLSKQYGVLKRFMFSHLVSS